MSYQSRGALQLTEYPSNFILSQHNGPSLWSMAPHDTLQAAHITTMHGSMEDHQCAKGLTLAGQHCVATGPPKLPSLAPSPGRHGHHLIRI